MNDLKNAEGLSVSNPILKIFNYILLLITVFIILFPLISILSASFKSDQEYMYSQAWDLPESFLNFDNFITVIEKGKLVNGLKNTTILIVFSLFGSLAMGTMVSYILSRFDFRFKKVIFLAYVVASLIPQMTTVIATFKIIQFMHLFNTIGAGIVLYLAAGITDIYIYLQFMNKIPKDLDESAMIDGASYFKTYNKIIIPQMKPAIFTVGILKTIGIYNDMFTPFLYMPSTKLSTISTGLMRFTADRNSQWNVLAAGILIVLLPTLIMYLFLQKYITSGVTEGAVKG